MCVLTAYVFFVRSQGPIGGRPPFDGEKRWETGGRKVRVRQGERKPRTPDCSSKSWMEFDPEDSKTLQRWKD